MSEVCENSQNVVFMDGVYVPYSDAKISVRAHAFLYGTSVFEGIRAYWNESEGQLYTFRMREHYERLLNSCKIMNLPIAYNIDELCEFTIELLRKNKPKCNTYLRPTAYNAAEQIGPKLLSDVNNFLVFSTPIGDYVNISKGLNVCVSNWRRVDDNAIPPRAKIAGSYANTSLIITEALKAGFDEAIVLSNDGKVTEGSAMNLYLVQDGKLVTTQTTDNILMGITRDTVKEIAQNEFGLEVIERTISRTELYISDEAFFCGTGAQISPIGSIDNRIVGEGGVGEITKKIQDLYFKVVMGEVEQYKKWLVPVYDN